MKIDVLPLQFVSTGLVPFWKLVRNKTEHAVQSYAADKNTLELMLKMKILSNKSVIAEY